MSLTEAYRGDFVADVYVCPKALGNNTTREEKIVKSEGSSPCAGDCCTRRGQ